MEKTYTAALFDLDGVLVDTAEYHYLAWKQLADRIGVAFDRKKNERLRGVPRMASLAILLEELPQKPENLTELADEKNRRYLEMIQKITPADLFPGVRQLLDTLRDNHIRIGLGSASKNARTVLNQLDIASYFEAIVDGSEVEHPKPSPDVFLRGAELIGIPPAQCVVIEDALAGIESAKAAGMYAIGITRDQPLPGADLCVKTPTEIPTELWIKE